MDLRGEYEKEGDFPDRGKRMFQSTEAKNSMMFPRNHKESRGLVVLLLCRTKSGCEKWQA